VLAIRLTLELVVMKKHWGDYLLVLHKYKRFLSGSVPFLIFAFFQHLHLMFACLTTVLFILAVSHTGYVYAAAVMQHPRVPNQLNEQKPTICRIFPTIPTDQTCQAVGYAFRLQVDKAGKMACCHQCFYNTNMVITCPEFVSLVKQKN